MPNLSLARLSQKTRVFSLSFSGLKPTRILQRSFVSIVLITALIAPMLFVGEIRIEARSAVTTESVRAPVSAPPEIYNMPEPHGSLFATWNRAIISTATSLTAMVLTGSSSGDEVSKRSGDRESDTKAADAEEPKDAEDTKTAETTEGETEPEAESNAIVEPPAPQPAAAVDFDFDGDGKADYSRWNPANTEFKIKNSNGGSYSTYTLGSSSSKPAPADYDGDGTPDAATFAAGTWAIRKSSDGTTSSISFGQAGDIPASGNYYGGTADELAYFRPSNGTWYYRQFSNGTVYTISWGTSGDIPVAGDYNGDGTMDAAIFRPSTGYWWLLYSGGGNTSVAWGNSADVPVPADFDGDGKTDPAIWRPSDGAWWSLKSSTSWTTYYAQGWGSYGDQPVAGDFDGDSKADLAVWRPSSGGWYILRSIEGAMQTDVLGVPGDTAVPSSYVKQVGSEVAPDEISKARLSPKNATGGTDLYSRNFSWGTSLVSLPGRNGLDLGLGLNYNSLVWTKVGATMLFDTDVDNVSPGFRLDFPTIEPTYYDEKTDKYNYLMVTPSGARINFRQTAASNTYETSDSSYAQLVTTGASEPNDPPEDITIKVMTTDGTQMSYEWKGGAFRCSQIKDRNGNYITISYNTYGLLQTATDTLGRVITVNYDTAYYPTSITQTWRADNGEGSTQTHTWATFSYTTKTIATDFADTLGVWGPPNGTELKVLEKVTYPDSSFTKFFYNGYAQVWKVENIAADSTSHVLNRVRTNLESPSADQTDCPRFTETRNFTENFNGGSETVVTNSIATGQSYTSPGGGTATATKIEVSMSSHPHNSVSKQWIAESGWKEGLTVATEDWADGTSGSERKRWTWADYTQDDTGVAYQTNPRVIETKVGDGTNTKRTTVGYHLYSSSTVAVYGLVNTVNVYDSDQSTILKTTATEYNLDSAYTSRRIIGLPSEVEVNGYNQQTSSSELVSRATYHYDEGNFSDSGLSQNISPVQHDNTNYGSSFITGRGNPTSVKRFNVEYPTNESSHQSRPRNTTPQVRPCRRPTRQAAL